MGPVAVRKIHGETDIAVKCENGIDQQTSVKRVNLAFRMRKCGQEENREMLAGSKVWG